MRDINEVAEEIRRVNTEVEEAGQFIDTSKDQLKTLAKEQESLRSKLEALDKAEKTLRLAIVNKRATIDENRKKLPELEREMIKVKTDQALREQLNVKGEILDIMTENAPWRNMKVGGPKNHQISGAKQLAVAERGILGDKRGLGKTFTSIIWLDMLGVDRAIILVPKEASTAFLKQMPRWAPHRPLFDMTSKPKGQREVLLNALKHIGKWNLLVNVESWRFDRTIIDKLVALKPEAVIIDEAHVIKDPESVTYQGVRSIVYPHADSALNPTKYVLAMSGTPWLNYPDELATLLHLVDRKAWPSRTAFRSDYLIQDFNGRFKFDKGRKTDQKLLSELGLRFVARDRNDAGVEIPPQEVIVHELEFDERLYPKQWKAYQDLEVKSAMLLSGMTDQQVMGVEGLALYTRLRQMITWPEGIQMKDSDGRVIFKCDVQESVKITEAEYLTQELVREGSRVVVFSQFKAPLNELSKRLKILGLNTVVLDGSTPYYLREQIKREMDALTTTGKYDVVLANYKVGGQSLDFTAADQMVILDEEWNPGRNDQAYGRIDRMGQTKETQVHILRVPETIDDVMKSINKTKADIIDSYEVALRSATEYLRDKAA